MSKQFSFMKNLFPIIPRNNVIFQEGKTFLAKEQKQPSFVAEHCDGEQQSLVYFREIVVL